MNRPHMPRADTFDLQDHDGPSVAEHSEHPQSDQVGNAPHLAAQVQHAQEERHLVEQPHADSWNMTGNQADQPGATEQNSSSNRQEQERNGVSQNGDSHEDGEDHEEEEEEEGVDDMMDRISSSPSIDDEDIDFEFVYALHTFVATIEGQANATKGDTMVLLDDSNSYWWLVRIVKDGSIGYLPAEHIETPTERLARLNKHRNIDLSATMLSDSSEKTRNPLKKAMRRRHVKTVQFAAPTYFEASDYEYSTEDEEHMIEPYEASVQQSEQEAQDNEVKIEREEPKVEPSDFHAESRLSTSSQRASFDREQAATAAQALEVAGVTADGPATIKLVDQEAAPLRSKKRTNTDSFLKHEGTETRKISLTPGLLREGLGGAKIPESVHIDVLEPLAKTTSPTEHPKKEVKDKKKEPKKGGMLSGLFKSKKKDKKTKEDASDVDSENLSGEQSRESPRVSPLPSGKTSPVEKTNGLQAPYGGPKANTQTGTAPAEETGEALNVTTQQFIAELQGSEAAYEMWTGNDQEGDGSTQRSDSETIQQDKIKSNNPLAPITNILKAGDGHEKPKKAKRSKQRVELDDFDSPQEESRNPFSDPQDEERGERLSESPVEISTPAFMHGTDLVHIPTPGTASEENDRSPTPGTASEENDRSQGEEEAGPGSLTSSPSIIEYPAEPLEDEGELVEDDDSTPTARSPQPAGAAPEALPPLSRRPSTDSNTTIASQPPPASSSPNFSPQTWSDDSLRAWLEDGSELRDMLVMINDQTGVMPVPAHHPALSGFGQQRKGVQNMMGQLDGLLGSYLTRKSVRF